MRPVGADVGEPRIMEEVPGAFVFAIWRVEAAGPQLAHLLSTCDAGRATA